MFACVCGKSCTSVDVCKKFKLVDAKTKQTKKKNTKKLNKELFW